MMFYPYALALIIFPKLLLQVGTNICWLDIVGKAMLLDTSRYVGFTLPP